MQVEHLNTLKAVERVSAYCAGHPIDSPPPGYAALVGKLGDTRAQLREYAVVQGAATQAARSETQRQDAVAERVRLDQLVPVRRIALAWLKGVPGIEAAFHVPPRRGGRQAVAVALRAMARNADPYGEMMIAHGRPADFIAQLSGAADEIERGIAAYATAAGVRSKATEGIVAAVVAAKGVLRQLDAVVRNLHAEDSAALAEWRAARRITQATGPRRTRNSQPANAQSGGTAASTTTAVNPGQSVSVKDA